MFLKILRIVSRFILHIIARVEIEGFEKIPQTGGAIVASNHLGRLDAMLGVVLANRDDIILMIAEKYQVYPFWRFMARRLDALWLDRGEPDLRTLRIVQKRLKAGGILGVAPEGTRSKTESLQPGKPGTVYLATKTGVPIIPVGIWGTEDRVVKERLSHLQRLDIHVRIGDPLYLPVMERKGRDEFLARHTEELMCQIAALLPPSYRGVYANHPRTLELLAEQPAPLQDAAGDGSVETAVTPG